MKPPGDPHCRPRLTTAAWHQACTPVWLHRPAQGEGWTPIFPRIVAACKNKSRPAYIVFLARDPQDLLSVLPGRALVRRLEGPQYLSATYYPTGAPVSSYSSPKPPDARLASLFARAFRQLTSPGLQLFPSPLQRRLAPASQPRCRPEGWRLLTAPSCASRRAGCPAPGAR